MINDNFYNLKSDKIKYYCQFYNENDNILTMYKMEELPYLKLVVFKHSLHKHKTEAEVGSVVIQQISLLGDLKT